MHFHHNVFSEVLQRSTQVKVREPVSHLSMEKCQCHDITKGIWGRIYISAVIFGKCHLPQDLTQPMVRVQGSQKTFLEVMAFLLDSEGPEDLANEE